MQLSSTLWALNVLGDPAKCVADVLIGGDDSDFADGEPGNDTARLSETLGDETGQDVLILDGNDEIERILMR